MVKGKNILVVEDVTNTGGSILKVIKSVRSAGGKVVAISVLVNRDQENIYREARLILGIDKDNIII